MAWGSHQSYSRQNFRFSFWFFEAISDHAKPAESQVGSAYAIRHGISLAGCRAGIVRFRSTDVSDTARPQIGMVLLDCCETPQRVAPMRICLIFRRAV